jgi:hypothetical protein
MGTVPQISHVLDYTPGFTYTYRWGNRNGQSRPSFLSGTLVRTRGLGTKLLFVARPFLTRFCHESFCHEAFLGAEGAEVDIAGEYCRYPSRSPPAYWSSPIRLLRQATTPVPPPPAATA